MSIKVEDLTNRIKELPLGDPEIDHSLLDEITEEVLEEIRISLVSMAHDNLVELLLQKREQVKEMLWYA